MKKVLCLILTFLLVLTLGGCGNEHDALIEEAVEELADAWEDVYRDSDIDSDYLEIKNTRIIYLTEDAAEEWEGFEDITCIIEFELYSYYFGEDSIPWNVDYLDCVVVDEDGDMEVVKTNLLQTYSAAYFSRDYSDIVESIEDLGSTYDQIWIWMNDRCLRLGISRRHFCP